MLSSPQHALSKRLRLTDDATLAAGAPGQSEEDRLIESAILAAREVNRTLGAKNPSLRISYILRVAASSSSAGSDGGADVTDGNGAVLRRIPAGELVLALGRVPSARAGADTYRVHDGYLHR